MQPKLRTIRITLVSTGRALCVEGGMFSPISSEEQMMTLSIHAYVSEYFFHEIKNDENKRAFIINVLRQMRNQKCILEENGQGWTEEMFQGEPNVVEGLMTNRQWKKLEGWV
jgi:hypothetical protein